MPALQFFAQNLSALLASNQAGNTQNLGQPSQSPDNKGEKNQFSSLLDIVGAADDAAQKPASYSDNSTDKNAGDNANSAGNNNAPDLNKKPSQPRTEKNNTITGNNKKTVVHTSRNQHYLTHKATKANDTAKTAEPVAQKSVNNANNATATQAEQQKIDDANNAKKANAPIDSAGGLLSIIASLLVSSPAPAPPVVETATDNNPITPTQILDKLQADLADLKGFINTANVDGAPTLSDAQNNELAQINTALAADLAGLKNLFVGQGENLAAQTTPTVPTLLPEPVSMLAITNAVGQKKSPPIVPIDAQQLADAQNLLQSDISLIKDALQKLKDAKSANVPTNVNVSVKNAPQIQQQMAFADMANFAQLPQPNQPITENNKPAENNKDNSAQATQILQVSQQNPQQQNYHITANAAVAGAINVAPENNFSGFSQNNSGGQNNNSQGQFSVGASSATSSAQTSGEVNKSTFSNMLSRTTQSNQANVAEQVVFQVRTAVKTGDSKISIQLHPEDLGKVDITMDVGANGKTSVSITADNKQTLDLLQSDSRGLQKALADAGLKADSGSLSFNLRGGQGEGSGGNQGQNQAQAASNYRKSQAEEEPILPAIATVTRSYMVKMPDGLDINI